MSGAVLLYGATGYTGQLILERCLARGLTPVLAGRSDAVQALAEAHGLEARVVGLADPARLRQALAGIQVSARETLVNAVAHGNRYNKRVGRDTDIQHFNRRVGI